MSEIAAIILRNRRGGYFVHQRSASKRLYPNLYGLGAGGRIEFGEEPLAGAVRELREETGIDVSDQKPTYFNQNES
jgi:8-oxo-dGTP pyrophosphatase MutT (NUDIX family)